MVAQTPAGDSAGPLDVAVTYNADIVCTITNTRETGKLEVVKDLNPSGDPGKFNLQINGNTDPDATNVGDGGSTGEGPLIAGTHNVGEVAGRRRPGRLPEVDRLRGPPTAPVPWRPPRATAPVR